MTKHMMFAIAILALSACGGTKRSTTAYRADTDKLLQTRNAQVKSCYEEALKQDPTLSGTVAVNFVVAKKTGAVTGASVDPNVSKSTEPLNLCVLNALQGLRLDPPDSNEGRASFVYVLQPASS